MQGDRIAASAVAQWAFADCLSWWNMKPICRTAIWKRDPTGLLQALMLITTKADGSVLVLKLFLLQPPHFFYPILSGLLAPCLSWSSSLCLAPRGLPELWNEVKLPHWHRSHWIALNRSQPSEKACFRGQNGIRCWAGSILRGCLDWKCFALCVHRQSSADCRWQRIFPDIG